VGRETILVNRKTWKLTYDAPAEDWNEALPLGNGSLGAMVFGGMEVDQIDLNLDTLWSGDGRYKGDKAEGCLHQARAAILDKDYHRAERIIREQILGDWGECYLPMGSLFLRHQGAEEGSDYSRQLDLNRSLYTSSYNIGEVRYQKEIFTSLSQGSLVIRMTASEAAIDLDIGLQSQLTFSFVPTEEKTQIMLRGNAPVYTDPDHQESVSSTHHEEGRGIHFGTVLQIQARQGEVEKAGQIIMVRGASEVLLLLSGRTDFGQGESYDPLQSAWQEIDRNGRLGYEALQESHEAEYRKYFDRVELELESDADVDLDPVSLIFHYGRYLMISSSKPGTQPGNLQGIWNSELRPPWNSDYTVNINTEMNYWIAEVCNLSEFHQPLFDLVERVYKQGQRTAREMYGLPGWVAHHNIDLWGHSTPVGRYEEHGDPCCYGFWPLGSGWLCRHLWEHYAFHGDRDFLRDTAFPLIRGAVEFYLAYLVEHGGYLVTIPSTSPENLFVAEDGDNHSVSLASTMDIAIIRELLASFVTVCQELDLEDPLVEEVEKALALLPPYRIGRYGQLQEWFIDYEEVDPHHRHLSHLYGLYPGDQIDPEGTPELAKACEVTLERRGDEGTGWSLAWKASLWARLKNGDKAFSLLERQLRRIEKSDVATVGGGTYPNLLCAHPPFQIDGNFGITAAIAEMILQSQTGRIVLVPALPKTWSKGRVVGLRARGGFTLSFSWENGTVVTCEITSDRAESCQVVLNGIEVEALFDRNGNFAYVK
jgi:alpha-L-fucosidase 2